MEDKLPGVLTPLLIIIEVWYRNLSAVFYFRFAI